MILLSIIISIITILFMITIRSNYNKYSYSSKSDVPIFNRLLLFLLSFISIFPIVNILIFITMLVMWLVYTADGDWEISEERVKNNRIFKYLIKD